MLEKIKQDFRPITWILIPIAVIVNGAGGWLITKLDLPLYLDTVGTIFVAVVTGPLAGAITGLVTNVILGLVSPGYAPYWPVPVLIGLAAGILANLGWFKDWSKVLLAGLIISVVASITSTLIAMRIHGNADLNPAYFLVEEPVDKIAAALIAFGTARFLPKQIFALLPRRENVTSGER
ncbi:MAG: ECF transporter S component [Chloroflexi bacterium]|nr:ECF transporter S component [Chloroflexota bacterium]